MAASNDEVVTLLDDEPGEHSGAAAAWRILITDDDPLVHEATQLALRGEHIAGRPLDLLHADSARQARAMLAADKDIHLILLDVVMESDDAGLRLVPMIREELGRKDVRIVIRTGQPGYAPEGQVREKYAIDGYLLKAQLTRSKLLELLASLLSVPPAQTCH
jgi:CheY-like chemotaxis protein